MRCFQEIEGADVFYINTYAATTPRLGAFKSICNNANGLEGTQSWSGSCVCVDVKHISSLNLLETSHSCISLVILDHVRVGLSDSDVFCWVLENASCSVGAFTWVL